MSLRRRQWDRRVLSWLIGIMAAAVAMGVAAAPVAIRARAQEASVRVTLDGQELAFDVPGQIVGGRTMVPFRGIFEALGATVEWDPANRTVYAVRGRDTVKLTVGSRVVEWRRSIIQVDVAPVVIDGRTLVPLRFIGQALGIAVAWEGQARTVVLETRPADAVLARGIEIVHQKACMVCHTINGVGGNIGPILNGVTTRHDEDWLWVWLRDPQAVRAGSRMPTFGFTPEEIEAVVAFLKTLQ